MNPDSPNLNGWIPAGHEDVPTVRAVLDEILVSAPFRSSRRYPAMLRYVVEKTLDSERELLKERVIGVEVFGRDPAYDTSADPVVRFSAGEIRKRLAQFYQESGESSPIIIDLPSGTYVPRLYRRAQKAEGIKTKAAFVAPEGEYYPNPEQGSPISSAPEAFRRNSTRTAYVLVVLIIAGCLIGGLLYKDHEQAKPIASPLSEIWSPLLQNPTPVVISAGQPMPKTPQSPISANISIGNYILRPQFRVSVSTLNAIANIIGYLKAQHKPFRIQEADMNTLANFHDRPVVLVAGNDNQWTVLLLKHLRFHFVQTGNFAYIEDTKHPHFRGWSIDFTKPFYQQTEDYAIVGRFYSATTGGPIIVAAGVSFNGTEAAGEYIVSPRALAQLQKLAPHGDLTQNFEAVLKVQVINGNTGAATVVASQFW